MRATSCSCVYCRLTSINTLGISPPLDWLNKGEARNALARAVFLDALALRAKPFLRTSTLVGFSSTALGGIRRGVYGSFARSPLIVLRGNVEEPATASGTAAALSSRRLT